MAAEYCFDDFGACAAWLERYRRRLLREREAAEDPELAARRRVEVMNAENPRFVLRGHMAAHAIDRAERGDFGEIHRLLELLRQPFEDQGFLAAEQYAAPPPDWAHDLVLT